MGSHVIVQYSHGILARSWVSYKIFTIAAVFNVLKAGDLAGFLWDLGNYKNNSKNHTVSYTDIFSFCFTKIRV